jgi:hypothetical protein
MHPVLNGFITVLYATLLGGGVGIALSAGLLPGNPAFSWVTAVAASFGLGYGLIAGCVQGYDFTKVGSWLLMAVDFTWSLPNTVIGFLTQLVYIFFGHPSVALSRGHTWIAYKPWTTTQAFGNSVLQTIGTVCLGGAGAHELVHLLQARIFGPLYIPLVIANYIVNFLIQVLWTALIGWILCLAGVRKTAYFCPATDSAVGGGNNSSGAAKFFGWIYQSTLIELWAYGTQHRHAGP